MWGRSPSTFQAYACKSGLPDSERPSDFSSSLRDEKHFESRKYIFPIKMNLVGHETMFYEEENSKSICIN
jgi:hypothetical protein